MTDQKVSVVIVSRHRPTSLQLCLLGLTQQLFGSFEIVVVTDPATVEGLGDWVGRIKIVTFDLVNISAARNAGIAVAAGEIVAFIDDDAVPEPTWLARLVDPIASGRAEASGGYVIGRNGISLQWGGRMVRPDATSTDIHPSPNGEVIITGTAQGGAKTEGTNMAFRADLLRRIGGFDPAFQYFLDETDLNMRLAVLGLRTAIVPGAFVHHGFAPSFWRRADRVPLTLFDIGASLAVYLRKHVGQATEAARLAEWSAQRRRLIRHMTEGRIEPGAVARLLSTFNAGWNDGLVREMGQLIHFAPPQPWLEFKPMRLGPVRRLTGRWSERRRLISAARDQVAGGDRVIVHIFSTTAFYHRRSFSPDGVWIQKGGQFGRSVRTDPLFRFWRLKDRSAREWALVADQKGGK